MQVTIIGISDEEAPDFSREVPGLLASCRYFAGGERHYELVKSALPSGHRWSNIVIPLAPFIEELRGAKEHCVIFASGDPLFFGIGNTLLRELPEADIRVIPTFNSLQLLAHRANLPYGIARVVSLTGRPWSGFDKAIIDNEPLIALLTDKVRNPATIADRLIRFGYTNYEMVLGERMGGAQERVRTLSLDEVLRTEFMLPNSIYLKQTARRNMRQGIPDAEFVILPGRPKMMTKMAIRLASLAAMDVRNRKVLWDVGACTGSISVEAKLMNPLLDVHAFEVRDEGREIILANAGKFGTPLSFYPGDFLDADTAKLPIPDAIFIGGYGGRMEEMLDKADECLNSNGVICFNAVSSDSRSRFIRWVEAKGYIVQSEETVTVNDNNPITIIAAVKCQK